MAKGQYLGEFELLILLAVIQLGETAYGVSIYDEIEQRTGREIALAQVYVTLDRLEKKGYVSSRFGNPTPERGGKAKRYFSIEASGATILRETLADLESMQRGLRPLPLRA